MKKQKNTEMLRILAVMKVIREAGIKVPKWN